MHRPVPVLVCLAVMCGALLFHTGQKVSEGRDALAALQAETAKERESLRVLAAEWSYLNQPARLEKLAGKHLELIPAAAKRIVHMEDVDAVAAGDAPKIAKTRATPLEEPAGGPAVRIVDTPPPASLLALPVEAAQKKKPALLKPQVTAEKRGFGDLMKRLGASP